MSLRPVVFMIGMMVTFLSAGMLVPAIVDLIAQETESARAFFLGATLGLFFGGSISLATRGPVDSITPRGVFLLMVGAWVALSITAALPMRLAGEGMDWTDALFEAVSGLTTTGATVLTGLDFRPPGFLLWRAILQWLGGIGIIVTAMAFWPMLGVGGMQLFLLETGDKTDKVLPKATQIAANISAVYAMLTLICAVAYLMSGMNLLDATAHAMSTLSTGGFSTSDQSMGKFMHTGADMITLVFMIAAALPFTLLVMALRGKPQVILKDAQARGFLFVVLVATAILTGVLVATGVHGDEPAWRMASFNAVSIITGTGYATTDYGSWGAAAESTFFVFMFIGGCAGSTSCSIKIFRYQIAGTAIRRYLAHLLRPNAIFPMRYNGRPVADSALHSVLGFFFVFFAVYAISAALLSAIGLDLTTALSGAATSLANVGPGLGDIIGPAGTFQTLPDAAKWILTANMLIGRLEVLAVLVVIMPRFWRS